MPTRVPYGTDWPTTGMWEHLAASVAALSTANLNNPPIVAPPPAWLILVGPGFEDATATYDEAYRAHPLLVSGAYTLWQVDWLRMGCLSGTSQVVDGVTVWGITGGDIAQGAAPGAPSGALPPCTWDTQTHWLNYSYHNVPLDSVDYYPIEPQRIYLMTQIYPYLVGREATEPEYHTCIGVVWIRVFGGMTEQDVLGIFQGAGLVQPMLAGVGGFVSVVGEPQVQTETDPSLPYRAGR